MSDDEERPVDVAAAPLSSTGGGGRPADPGRPAPVVLAVIVTRDGTPWLEDALEALEAQSYDALEIIGVDNGSGDASREVLIDRLGHDRVLLAERDIGFGAAVAMALDTAGAREASYLLTVHDDMVLEPQAVDRLVGHLEQFPDVAAAGTKNLDWEDPGRLQSVGFAVDVTGRAHSGLEPDERDHGQRDHVRRVLYASTSGLLVRREVFERLDGFDRRYHLFRDDLDLCWRMWLAGHEVEVVPSAQVRHVASATNYDRLGQTAFLGPRYFAERNTLATLLKNYGTPRLVRVIPLFFLVGVMKVFGFVATRRVGDAWQTLRAWAWNLLHLRETWRLRRRAQRLRRVSDRELRPLFARTIPRARAYLEAIIDWVSGGEYRPEGAGPQDGDDEPETITAQIATFARRHPAGTAAGVLGVAGLVLAVPVLVPGSLRGGELAPWPSGPVAFLGDYLSAWHDAGAVGTSLPPSPAQAILGLLDVAALSNQWLASRLLILGTLPLAWLLTLRATAVLTDRRLPRMVAATAYVLSPPAVAAVQTGRVSALVLTVAIPGLVIAFTSILRPGGSVASAWRATAAATLLGAVAVAFAPLSFLGLVVWIAVALIALRALGTQREAYRVVAVRLVTVGVGVLALLLPWSLRLLSPSGPLFTGGVQAAGGAGDGFWRWLFLAPDAPGFPGAAAGLGLLAAGLVALALTFRSRPLEVAGLWGAALTGVYMGWGLAEAGQGAIAWSGLPLVLSAAAFAALLALGLTSAAAALREHDFGWRHVAAGVTGAAVAIGLGAAGWSFVAGDAWEAYAVEQPALPAFLASQPEETGPFRVLVLRAASTEEAGSPAGLQWDVTRPEGPTMAAYGVPLPDGFVTSVNETVRAISAGENPGAAGTLAVLNIGYVVVPPGGDSPALGDQLADQLALEPQPVEAGRVYRVEGALPRAAWVPRGVVEVIAQRGEVPEGARVEPLEPAGQAWRGEVPGPGAVVLSHVEDAWQARTADGEVLQDGELGPVRRYPVGEETSAVTLSPGGQIGRAAGVGLQAALVFLVFSLALRPPRFARAPRPAEGRPLVRHRVAELPGPPGARR